MSTSTGNFFRLLHTRARDMRENPTSAERALHQRLLFIGFRSEDIQMQFVLAPYVYDCYIKSLKLLIEADGLIHQQPELRKRDEKKARLAKKKGYLFIRMDKC